MKGDLNLFVAYVKKKWLMLPILLKEPKKGLAARPVP